MSLLVQHPQVQWTSCGPIFPEVSLEYGTKGLRKGKLLCSPHLTRLTRFHPEFLSSFIFFFRGGNKIYLIEKASKGGEENLYFQAALLPCMKQQRLHLVLFQQLKLCKLASRVTSSQLAAQSGSLNPSGPACCNVLQNCLVRSGTEEGCCQTVLK